MPQGTSPRNSISPKNIQTYAKLFTCIQAYPKKIVSKRIQTYRKTQFWRYPNMSKRIQNQAEDIWSQMIIFMVILDEAQRNWQCFGIQPHPNLYARIQSVWTLRIQTYPKRSARKNDEYPSRFFNHRPLHGRPPADCYRADVKNKIYYLLIIQKNNKIILIINYTKIKNFFLFF